MGKIAVFAAPGRYGDAQWGIGTELWLDILEEFANNVVAVADDFFELWW